MKTETPTKLSRAEVLRWLKTDAAAELETLWRMADEARARCVGDEVHLRGLVEIGNICSRHCHYCGIRSENRHVNRYRMPLDEILAVAWRIAAAGYRTIVLQAGEDAGFTEKFIAELIQQIKKETQLTVTLSLGERSEQELFSWKKAGANRYLLRFETSNAALFHSLHPPKVTGQMSDRISLLNTLRKFGYEIGSGMLVGLPGQTWGDLANDILLLRELDLDMVGLGPFIPDPDTPLGSAPPSEVPATEHTTYKAIALARIVCPTANIPSTTALATLNPRNGHELALQRGANIIMPNFTPAQYRTEYRLYPDKASIDATSNENREKLHRRIEKIGRKVGKGAGTSPNFTKRGSSSKPEKIL